MVNTEQVAAGLRHMWSLNTGNRYGIDWLLMHEIYYTDKIAHAELTHRYYNRYKIKVGQVIADSIYA